MALMRPMVGGDWQPCCQHARPFAEIGTEVERAHANQPQSATDSREASTSVVGVLVSLAQTAMFQQPGACLQASTLHVPQTISHAARLYPLSGHCCCPAAVRWRGRGPILRAARREPCAARAAASQRRQYKNASARSRRLLIPPQRSTSATNGIPPSSTTLPPNTPPPSSHRTFRNLASYNLFYPPSLPSFTYQQWRLPPPSRARPCRRALPLGRRCRAPPPRRR